MSHPSSRSSSAHPPSRSSSGIFPSSSSTLQPSSSTPHENHKFSSKLRHMFESQKHASFIANVTIIEIGNVPQLSGNFEATYEFLGKAPKAKDSLMASKQSVPDLKISTIHHAGSTTSLRSTATGQISPLSRLHPISPTKDQGSSTSGSLGRRIAAPAASRQPSLKRGPTKRPSDPTPLRQSIKSEENTTPLASPSIDITDEPEEAGDLRTQPMESSSLPTSQQNIVASAQERDPDFSFAIPEPRAGTHIDPAIILGDLSSAKSSEPPDAESEASSSTNDVSHNGTAPSSLASEQYRDRSASSITVNDVHNSRLKSHRRGRTPARPLKEHTCTWNYQVEHSLRINVNRSSNNNSRTNLLSPNSRQESPPGILGSGPTSESGLKISIEQVLAPHRHASEDGLAGMDTKRAAHGRAHFGTVHVDLAPFAGKGKLTRRFLLMGSKTNATVKLAVELKWLGGESNWVAPPLKEGHHVTGVVDLVGQEAEETLGPDLNLSKTPSNSSSSSSALSGAAQSRNPSMASSINLSRTGSNLSMTNLPPVTYKSYEHHLLPEPTPPSQPRQGLNPFRRPNSGNPGVASDLRSRMSLHRQHRHAHHSVHIREGDSLKKPHGLQDLPPDLVIERIFNPTPSSEDGPFTYIPARKAAVLLGGMSLDKPIEFDRSSGFVEDDEVSEPETPMIGGREMKNGWLRGRRERRELREKERRTRGAVV